MRISGQAAEEKLTFLCPSTGVIKFAKFMSVIKALGNRVEQEHMKHLAELKRLEESSSGGGLGLGNGPANSGIGAVVVPSADVADFESLVRGNVNGHRVGGLAARGSQVDIFADISPVPSPAPEPQSGAFAFGRGAGPTRSGSGSAAAGFGLNGVGATGGGSAAYASPPLPSLPTSSPPFASTSTFAATGFGAGPAQQQQQERAVRPTPSSRLSSTPSLTPSSSSVGLRGGRDTLGSRPAVAPTSYLVSPPPGVSATPSNAPTPTPTASTLRSFAPLQPTGASSSPSSRTVTSASLAQSIHTSSPQPNYNLSLATTSSLGGLPPLQPTTSSLFVNPTGGGGVAGAPAPPRQQPSAVQWNRIPSSSSSSAAIGASNAPLSSLAPATASRPPPPSSAHSSSLPAAAAVASPQQRAFPPGYNPSSASASLVPLSSASSASQPRLNANAGPAQHNSGGARTLDFGAWADLDPLK